MFFIILLLFSSIVMFSFFVYLSKGNYNKLKCYFIDIKFRIFKQFNMTDENHLWWNGYDEFFAGRRVIKFVL